MEPVVRIRHRFDWFLVLPRVVFSEFLPRMRRMGDVLHGTKGPCLVFSLEVERTEVDRVVGRAIDAMKRYTDEACALNVLALHIQFDGAIGEFDSRQVCRSFALSFAQTNTLSVALAEAADGPVGGIQAFPVGQETQIGLDRFLLRGNPERS